MAETTAKTTTTPRKPATRRTAAKPAAAKTAPAKAAAKPPAPKEETPAEAPDRFVVELEFVEDTKGYAKFAVPQDLKGTMVGSIYAPHGTDRVKVAIYGVDTPDDDGE